MGVFREAFVKRPEFIARQAARPHGLLGRMLACLMARETSIENASALGALCLQHTDRVLEVGFGHGYQLGQLARAVQKVWGVDHSEEMVSYASRQLEPLIQTGRVEVLLGDARELPFPDAHFDKALSVHTLYFLEEPALYLRELRRVLKPGAHLVLGYCPGEDRKTAKFPRTVYSFYERPEIERLLREAGFTDTRIRAPTKSFHLAVAMRPKAGV